MEINVFAELSAAEQEALLERPAHSSQDGASSSQLAR